MGQVLDEWTERDRRELSSYLKDEFFLVSKKTATAVGLLVAFTFLSGIGISIWKVPEIVRAELESDAASKARRAVLSLLLEVEQSASKIKDLEAKIVQTRTDLLEAKVDSLVAKKISLVDSNNALALLLAIDERNVPTIKLFHDGRLGMYIVAGQARSGLRLYNDSGENTVALLSEKKGNYSQLFFGDNKGARRLELGYQETMNSPSIKLWDKNGGLRLEYEENMSVAGFAFLGSNKTYAMKIGTNNSDRWNYPYLTMIDKDGDRRFIAEVNRKGTAHWTLLNNDETTRLTLATEYGESGTPSLSLYDSLGQYRLGIFENSEGFFGINALDSTGDVKAVFGSRP